MKLINFWPPFIGAGVKVIYISDDFTAIDVEMKLRFWNKNYVGVHFGGSLYAMVDPFFMLMLMENLGKDYIVWDKAATIRFKKPGKGIVRASFRLSQDQISSVKHDADQSAKVEPKFQVEIIDKHGVVIAEVEKLLYVRRKQQVATEFTHSVKSAA